MKLIFNLVLVTLIFSILCLYQYQVKKNEKFLNKPPGISLVGTLKKKKITAKGVSSKDLVNSIRYQIAEIIKNIKTNQDNSIICNENINSNSLEKLPESCKVCDNPKVPSPSSTDQYNSIYMYLKDIKPLFKFEFEENYKSEFEKIDFTETSGGVIDSTPAPTSSHHNYTCNIRWEGDNCPHILFYIMPVPNQENQYNFYFIINQEDKNIHDHLICFIDQESVLRESSRCKIDINELTGTLTNYISNHLQKEIGYIRDYEYFNPNLKENNNGYHITQKNCNYYAGDNREKQLQIYNFFENNILRDVIFNNNASIDQVTNDLTANLEKNKNNIEYLYKLNTLFCMLSGHEVLKCSHKNFINPYHMEDSILYHPNSCCLKHKKDVFLKDICQGTQTPGLSEACKIVNNTAPIDSSLISNSRTNSSNTEMCKSKLPPESINLKKFNPDICDKIIKNIKNSEDKYEKYHDFSCPSMEESKDCNTYCGFSMNDIFKCNYYEYFTDGSPENIQENFACLDKKIDDKTPFIDDDTSSDGKSCAKHEELGLCKDGKWLNDMILPKTKNDPELSAKEACCVCGGGDEIPDDDRSHDKLLKQKLLELSNSQDILLHIKILNEIIILLSDTTKIYNLAELFTEEIKISENFITYYRGFMNKLISIESNVIDVEISKDINSKIEEIKTRINNLSEYINTEPKIESIKVTQDLKTKLSEIKKIISNKEENNLGILEIDIIRNDLVSNYLEKLSPSI